MFLPHAYLELVLRALEAMGKWCLNKEIDMLLNDAKTTFKLLEDKINILIEEKI